MADDPFIPNNLKLCTAEQSRQMDDKTINGFGIDGFTLMEIAASRASFYLQMQYKNNKSGLFVCGKGNNGGDALAVARYLVNEVNHKVTVFMVMGDKNLSPDAEKNYSLLKEMSNRKANITFVSDLEQTPPTTFDYIVDGIFGTGLNNEVRLPLSKIINSLNKSGTPVFAMDVPSGLNVNDGTIHGTCIKAISTYTFGSNKIGFYLNNAKEYTGNVIFVDLPFPEHIRLHEGLLINKHLTECLPLQSREAKHKYDGGVVHILAGSEGLTGAAIMCAKSAWKQGAGAVFLYTPRKQLKLYEAVLPQVIKVGLGDDDSTYLKKEYAEKISGQINSRNGVLLMGPGLGSNPETGKCLFQVLQNHDGKAVIDADAFRFWKKFETLPTKKRKKWLLTPHIGEAKTYLGAKFNSELQRLKWVKQFSTDKKCSILLKGNPSILASISGEMYLTEYNTDSFARAGFGDVLAGTLASNMATIGRTDNAIIHSLFTGYEKYCETEPGIVFGPEHLT